jgi:hypothetical protein
MKKELPPELLELIDALNVEENYVAGDASDGLRLLKAFTKIKSRSLRTAIIEFVEKIAPAKDMGPL